MARWKLQCAHYLRVEDCEWEYIETDRATMRPVRRRFQVPRFLDPKSSSDWNYRQSSAPSNIPSNVITSFVEDGEIVVCWKDKGDPRDIVFFGDPTPDMEPLDDEAKAVSATFEEAWKRAPDDIQFDDYSQSLLYRIQAESAEAAAKPVQIEGLSDLVAAMAASQAQTQELLKSLVTRRL